MAVSSTVEELLTFFFPVQSRVKIIDNIYVLLTKDHMPVVYALILLS